MVFLWGTITFVPGSLYPGNLLEGHLKYKNDCFICHTPFSGPNQTKCLACHKPGEIKSGKEGLQTFHKRIDAINCMACHTEHKGKALGKAVRKFDHDLLGSGLRGDCVTCHTSPQDRLHTPETGNCSRCHTARSWRSDNMDHSKYFRFDRHHQAECTVCHPNGDYAASTCYGCHDHSPRDMEKEHREENIREIEKCVKCHRSGDKHETRGRSEYERNDGPSRNRDESLHETDNDTRRRRTERRRRERHD